MITFESLLSNVINSKSIEIINNYKNIYLNVVEIKIWVYNVT